MVQLFDIIPDVDRIYTFLLGNRKVEKAYFRLV